MDEQLKSDLELIAYLTDGLIAEKDRLEADVHTDMMLKTRIAEFQKACDLVFETLRRA